MTLQLSERLAVCWMWVKKFRYWRTVFVWSVYMLPHTCGVYPTEHFDVVKDVFICNFLNLISVYVCGYTQTGVWVWVCARVCALERNKSIKWTVVHCFPLYWDCNKCVFTVKLHFLLVLCTNGILYIFDISYSIF